MNELIASEPITSELIMNELITSEITNELITNELVTSEASTISKCSCSELTLKCKCGCSAHWSRSSPRRELREVCPDSRDRNEQPRVAHDALTPDYGRGSPQACATQPQLLQ